MPSKTRVLHFWCRFFEKICPARTRSPATREFAGTGTANDHAKMARRIAGERPKSPRRAGVLSPRRKARAHSRIEPTPKSACPQNRFSRTHNWKPKINEYNAPFFVPLHRSCVHLLRQCRSPMTGFLSETFAHLPSRARFNQIS